MDPNSLPWSHLIMNHLLTLLPLVVLGCSESNLTFLNGNKAGDGPQIEVTPVSLDFGVLVESDEASVRTFVIRSVGNEDLTIDSIDLSGQAAASFTVLTTGIEGTILPVGAEEMVEIAFLPLGANQQSAQAIVSSDAGNAPRFPVSLLGEGAIAELRISPDPMDFGRTYVGCDKDNLVTMQNVGTDSLTIHNISLDGDEFEIFDESVTLPLTLAPNESVSMGMSFTPFLEGEADGVLKVLSDEPMGSRTAAQVGEGVYAAEYIDEWESPANSPSDIVFFVDQSCSMDSHSALLANNFSNLIANLDTYSTDWQIAVINDDNGCNHSGILTPSMGTASYISAFRSAVSTAGGFNTEQLLSVAQSGIEKTDSGECNSGLLRSNALLHLIFVSDEEEQSPGRWENYVNTIIAKKGSADNVRMSAIVGNNDTSCFGMDSSRGTRYVAAATDTDGIALEICSDWAIPSNLEMLAEASVIQNTYELTNDAIEETVVVEVNGSTVSASDYYYDAPSNSVIFTNNTPEEGDTITISYASPATCD